MSKTTTTTRRLEDGISQTGATPEQLSKTVTATSKKKKPKGKHPAVNVAGGETETPLQSNTYKCIRLNVNGIAEKPKRDRIFHFIRTLKQISIYYKRYTTIMTDMRNNGQQNGEAGARGAGEQTGAEGWQFCYHPVLICTSVIFGGTLKGGRLQRP